MPDSKREIIDDEIVQSAPVGTPTWSLGITFILATFLSSFVGVYLAVSPDIQKYLDWKKEENTTGIGAIKELSLENNKAISGIVAVYSTQVAELSKTVGALEKEAVELRVNARTLQMELNACKAATQP